MNQTPSVVDTEQIVLKADINSCEISGWQSNTGEVNARVLQVDLSEALSKCANAFVTFTLMNGTVYESKVTDGKAEVPTIDRPQYVDIGVYTTDVEGDKCIKRYSPKPTQQYISRGSYAPESEAAPIPTAGTYAELLKKINDADVVKKSEIVAEIDVDGEFTEGQIYNALAINVALTNLVGLIDGINEKLDGEYTQALELLGGAE